MPLSDLAPMTLRFVFAAAAADPRTSLSATQRAAIRVSLADETWCPRQAELPDTWATVAGWYERIQAQTRAVTPWKPAQLLQLAHKALGETRSEAAEDARLFIRQALVVLEREETYTR